MVACCAQLWYRAVPLVHRLAAGAPRLAIHRVTDGEDDVVEIEVVHKIR